VLDVHHHVRRFGVTGVAEVVLSVDVRVESAGARLEGQTIGIAESARRHLRAGAVGVEREDRRALGVGLSADVTSRATPQVETTIRANRSD